LKTRPSRFERIRREKGAQRGEIVVTDFLKPDLDEIYGILPDRLVAPFARWAERRWPYGRPAFGQEVKTTTVLGYLRVWLLTLLRPLRPISYRARHEHARMDRWLAALARCAGWDKALALEVARGAQLVKGYGDVRRRMTAHFDRLLAGVMRAAEWEAANRGGFEASRERARRRWPTVCSPVSLRPTGAARSRRSPRPDRSSPRQRSSSSRSGSSSITGTRRSEEHTSELQ